MTRAWRVARPLDGAVGVSTSRGWVGGRPASDLTLRRGGLVARADAAPLPAFGAGRVRRGREVEA